MTSDKAEQLRMVEDCEQHESNLNNWERGFIASMRELLDADMHMYDTQVAKLEQIWNKVTRRKDNDAATFGR